jgi:hypothetical protein
MGSPVERLCSQRYAESLSELAHERGFGFVDRGKRSRAGAIWRRSLEVIPSGRAARYLAKYVAGVKPNGRLALSETVSRRDAPALVVYVDRRLTLRTGCSMRSLRRRRWAHVLVDRAHQLGRTDLLLVDGDDEHLIAVLAPILGRAP